MYKYLLIIFLIFTGCQTQKELKVQKQISNTKPVVLFLLDNSNSFNKKNIKTLQSALHSSIKNINKKKINLGLIASTKNCNQAILKIDPFKNNKQTFNQAITSLSFQGYSNISALLIEAKKILNYVKQPINIILISSQNKLCNHSAISLTKKLTQYHQKLKIYTIDYKTGYNYFSLLKDIAKIGHGKYYVATNRSNLTSILNTITKKTNKDLHVRIKKTVKSLYTVHFQYNSSRLLPKDQKKLKQVAHYLQTHYYKVEIQGHTDSKGSAKLNQKVSLKRANEVANKLLKLGVDKKTIKRIIGYGESRPIATNKTEEGRRKNRRVEIHLLK